MVKHLRLSRSQLNRKIKEGNSVRRSLDERGKYVADLPTIVERAFRSGIAIIEGHVFSTEKDIMSAMVKCIKKSKCGRTRESFERMFRCHDLGKSFRKLEKRENITIIKLERKILYLYKKKKEEQIKNYYQKKGILLREQDKENITIAMIFTVIKYENLSEIESAIRKDRKNGGRRPFPFKAMVNAIFYLVLKKLKYFSVLSTELKHDSDLAVALGFESNKSTPSPSCFSRFVQQVGKHVRKNIDKELERLLKQKKELRKKGKKIKVKRNNKKRTKSHRRNFIPLTYLNDEIKALNKKIAALEKEVPENGWYLIFADLVSQLLTLRIIDGKIVCLDATHINTSKKDPNQSYGVKRAKKQADGTMKIIKDFFGYKLHIAVDAKTNLPVAITITTGCVADNKEAPKIIRQLKRHGIFFKALLADGGYNDKKIYREVYNYNKEAKFVSPLPKNEGGSRPNTKYYYDEETRQRYEIHSNTEEGKALFRMRGPTENINKIIKCDLKMDKPKVRGIRAIESLAYIHCTVVLILAIAAKLTAREHLINQFSNVV